MPSNQNSTDDTGVPVDPHGMFNGHAERGAAASARKRRKKTRNGDRILGSRESGDPPSEEMASSIGSDPVSVPTPLPQPPVSSETAFEDMNEINSWSVGQVADWLDSQGFYSISRSLHDHRVDGRVLVSMTEADLLLPLLDLRVFGDVRRLTLLLDRMRRNGPADNHTRDREPSWRGTASTRISRPNSLSPKIQPGISEPQPLEIDNYNCSLKILSALKPSGSSLLEKDAHSPSDIGAENDALKQRNSSKNLRPDYRKMLVAMAYAQLVLWLTSYTMVVVHDRVPDVEKYPPLPDLVLDNVPYISWAFQAVETTGIIMTSCLFMILTIHKHRAIIWRRCCALTGTVFLLRCVTMLITSLSVPGAHLKCDPSQYPETWMRLNRAFVIWSGFGMTLQGVRTCGDYMFSGHTTVLTMLNMFITEYTPSRWYPLHTAAWVANLFGIFFILAAHEHYSIDVFVAFYISSRLFLYYHSLANTSLLQKDRRTRIWFPLFSYFEENVDGEVPNEYEWPFSFNPVRKCYDNFKKVVYFKKQ